MRQPPTIQAGLPGVLNINLVQGNTKVFALDFSQTDVNGVEQPINLNNLDNIILAVREQKNVKSRPFLILKVGEGLQVIGPTNSTLQITFSKEFWNSQQTNYYYDILFEEQPQVYTTILEGEIVVDLTVTKYSD